MERIEITKPIVGICYMQVCAEEDVTDDQILEVCNKNNPSGTMNGWSEVIRGEQTSAPVNCEKYEGRKHFMVAC